MTGSEVPHSFRLAYVPGVTPSKWVRIWNERLPDVPLTLVAVSPTEAFGVLRAGGADAGFVRLPVDGTDLSAIPLYTETTVVVVPKDHLVAAAEEVSTEDLADEIVFHPLDDTLDWQQLPGRPALERPETTADAIELVAAGVGVLVVPQSLARLHHRKDLTYRPVSDAPASRVALSWPQEETTDLVEEFIGIVRGRTVNSTRGRAPTPPQPKTKRKRPETGSAGGGGGAQRKPGAGKSAGGKSGSGKSASGKPAGKNPRGGSAGSGGAKGGRSGKPRRRP
ncbi:LysR substrate-binding domain-containing protein [Streptomyces sp. NPDC054932]